MTLSVSYPTTKRLVCSVVLGLMVSWIVGLTILISAFLLGLAKSEFSYPLPMYVGLFIAITVLIYLKFRRFVKSIIISFILFTVQFFILMIIVLNQNPDIKGVGFVLEITPWSVYLGKP